MAEALYSLSGKELDRVGVIEAVVDRRLSQREAAKRLGLSVRQVKRLARRLREGGKSALASRRRGQPSNNRLPATLREQTLGLVRQRYADFGPTLAHEKLTEVHRLSLSVETLRQWMSEAGLWQAKRRKAAKAFQLRERRPCVGELIQIDGSPHDWFEGRAARCTLIVFIDDASGQLLALRFAPTETTQAYMQTLSGYLSRYGRPVSLYSDRHSIFRLNAQESEGLTQFGRALASLDIEAIHARTPQAKGRVERANQTLQDRLVKEMRLSGIDSIDAANAFVERFRVDFNRRFAIAPKHADDAHRPLLHTPDELARIFSLHSTRTLSKSLSLQYRNTLYQVQGRGAALRHAKVTVCEGFDGGVTLLYRDKPLAYTTYQKGQPPSPLEDEKTLNQRVDHILSLPPRPRPPTPKPNHPWRRYPETNAAG